MNDLDRFHLVIDVIDHVPSLGSRAALLRQEMVDARAAARRYTREHGDDIPSVRDWTWGTTTVPVHQARTPARTTHPTRPRRADGTPATETPAETNSDQRFGRGWMNSG